MDDDNSGTIDILVFDNICMKFSISFTKEELKRIAKSFAAESQDEYDDYNKVIINYKRLSYFLGLHKNSFNYIAGGSTHGSTAQKIYKIKQAYNSIEPSERSQDRNRNIYNDSKMKTTGFKTHTNSNNNYAPVRESIE